MPITDPTNMEEHHAAPDNQLNTAVFALWGRFREMMFERLKSIEMASGAALNNSMTDAQRGEALNAAHKLAGSLGTFGLGEGSKLASKLELMLEGAELLGSEQSRHLGELAKMLRKEMERGPTAPARP